MKIKSSYRGRCRICKLPYNSGDEIEWEKGIKGGDHWSCKSEPKTDKPEPKTSDIDHGINTGNNYTPRTASNTSGDWFEWSINYRQLVTEYRKFVKDPDGYDLPYAKRFMETYKRSVNRDWSGATTTQMLKWISVGYKPELMKGTLPMPSDLKPRRKLRLKDEGELMLDLAWSGHDYPYQAWDKRPTKPSMKIRVGMIFGSNVSHSVIEKYLVWCARIMNKLELEGIDVELSITCPCSDLHTTKGSPPNSRINIIVKKLNEKFTFTSWSAIVSPGGYRHLMFLAEALSGKDAKSTISTSLGSCINEGWNVKFNDKTRLLDISCDSSARDGFPTIMMDKQFEAALELARH